MREQEKELSFEKIRELLGNKPISDEAVKRLMKRIRQFCKVAYQLYAQRNQLIIPKPVESLVLQNDNTIINNTTE